MQLVSPDFAEPKARRNSGSGTFRMAGSGAIPGSSGDLDASPSSRRERRITVWMSTSAFPEACRTALSLAALARIVLRDFRPLLAGNIFNEYFERPASFAAWFSVLVLRRFSAVFASAWEAEWAHAYGLHEALEKDARTCLELLRASDRPETEPVWALLQGLLDGQELRLSRRDAQMIGLAKRAIRTCRHGHGGGPVAGSCWTCAEKRSRRKAGSTEGSAGSGSLIAAVPEDSEEDTDSEGEEGDGSSFLSVTRTASWIAGNASALPGKPGAKKQVRFHPELEIIPTYSADEYPARSARAPDDPELEVAAQDLGVPASFSLAAMLSMRGGEPASDSDSDSDSQGDW
ncbi:hypothetical protein DFJ74DRAFT_695459 [Hyaloraphidium curvatum]|nr:hypothetical protein DFJ74DRAFT_695459 [Hyaloraphidium curvatum]